MKSFRKIVSEVAEPKSGDEKNFKDKHIVTKVDYPVDVEDQFTGGKTVKKAPKRKADLEAGEDEKVYEAMDPVNKKAALGKFKHRADKDIDNDGDVDSSDKYLHARRKAVTKAIHKEEAEDLKEISRDLARSYIRKAAAAGGRKKGIEMAGKKAYGIGGEPKVRATEEVEQLAELSPNTLHSYIKKAAGNMAGNAAVGAAQASSSMKKSSPDVKRNIRNRMRGITGASGRLADKANMAEDAWEEVPMMMRQLDYIAYAAEDIIEYLDTGVDPEEWFQNKLAHIHGSIQNLHAYVEGEKRMMSRMDYNMYGEEAELDEKLVGGQKKLDHNKNGKIDSHDFKLMRSKKMKEEAELDEASPTKKAITRALQGMKVQPKEKVTVKKAPWEKNEEVELDEVSKGLTGRYLDKARAQRGVGKDREKSIGLAYRKSTPGKRADSGYDSEPKVYAKEDLDESITKMSHGRLKFHLNTSTPHGSYSNDEMKSERDRRLKTGEGEAYRKAKAGLSEVTQTAMKKTVSYIDPKGHSRTRDVPVKRIEKDERGQDKIRESVEMLDEAFKAGMVKLKDGGSVILKKEDADLLNKMFKDLSSTNRKKMQEVAMKDKNGFDEILGFAREAL